MAKPEAAVTLTKYKTREITLPRSKIVVSVPEDWHVSDTNASQRYGKGDVPRTNLALAQRVCLFNGAKWTIEDIEEKISGRDWLKLIGELYTDEDDAKNE